MSFQFQAKSVPINSYMDLLSNSKLFWFLSARHIFKESPAWVRISSGYGQFYNTTILYFEYGKWLKTAENGKISWIRWQGIFSIRGHWGPPYIESSRTKWISESICSMQSVSSQEFWGWRGMVWKAQGRLSLFIHHYLDKHSEIIHIFWHFLHMIFKLSLACVRCAWKEGVCPVLFVDGIKATLVE